MVKTHPAITAGATLIRAVGFPLAPIVGETFFSVQFTPSRHYCAMAAARTLRIGQLAPFPIKVNCS